MDTTGFTPMVSTKVGTRPNRLQGAATDGLKSFSLAYNNASMDDESGIGKTPDDGDYHASSPKKVVGGSRRT